MQYSCPPPKPACEPGRNQLRLLGDGMKGGAANMKDYLRHYSAPSDLRKA